MPAILILLLAATVFCQTARLKPIAEDVKPTPQDFEAYESYVEALVRWTVLNTSKTQLTSPQVAALEIAGLKAQIEEFKRTVSKLEDDLKSADLQQQFDISELKHQTAYLDPAIPAKYSRVDTVVGPMLVLLEKIDPYLDGYRVSLKIGNVLSASFRGFQVDAVWGPRVKQGMTSANWEKRRRTKTFSFPDELTAAVWTNVNLILPETKAEDFGYLSVSVSINTASLANK